MVIQRIIEKLSLQWKAQYSICISLLNLSSLILQNVCIWVGFGPIFNFIKPIWVLMCPAMSWACSGHAQVMSEPPSNSFMMHFFRFFWFFFFHLKSIFFLESWLTPAMLGHFTLILLLNFHMLARKGHQTASLHEILTHL